MTEKYSRWVLPILGILVLVFNTYAYLIDNLQISRLSSAFVGLFIVVTLVVLRVQAHKNDDPIKYVYLALVIVILLGVALLLAKVLVGLFL